MPQFETARLTCLSLTPAQYTIFENGQEPQWEGFTNPYQHLIVGPSPMVHRIPRVKADPGFADLGLFLAINKETKEIIGSFGFHDRPDERGMIEIGYGIVPEMQNQGFGTEMLLGAWRWIAQNPEVKILRYTVSPDNAPSLHIVKKLGLDLVGEQWDEEDGLELIFETASSTYH